ncbi:hypothetical protein LTR94_037618, partial [Friedmanniomyces endolithicus]
MLTRELDLAVTFDTRDTPGLARIELGHTELVHLSRRPGHGPLALADIAGDAWNDPRAEVIVGDGIDY